MLVPTMTGVLWLTLDAFAVGVGFTAGCWVWRRIFGAGAK